MLRHTALPTPRTDRRNSSLIDLSISAISSGRELDERVKRDVEPW